MTLLFSAMVWGYGNQRMINSTGGIAINGPDEFNPFRTLLKYTGYDASFPYCFFDANGIPKARITINEILLASQHLEAERG